ncbi:MAG: hypothetical protein ABI467_17005 [Kofleriaceae bacterium]
MATTTTLPPTQPIDQLFHKLSDAAMSRAKHAGFRTALRTRAYVESHPFQGIAMAFGIGYLARSLFPGPVATLAMVGGAAYVAAKLAK